MTNLNIKDQNGVVNQCQMCQFEINPNQQVLVVGCNHELDESYEVSSADYVEVTLMGSLRTLQPVFSNQVINSMNLEKWNWKACWDPQVVMLEDKRSYAEIMATRVRNMNKN